MQCPHCHSSIYAKPAGLTLTRDLGVFVSYGGKRVRLTRRLIDILDVLVEAYPRAVPLALLANEFYPTGTERKGEASIGVAICDLRKRFREASVPLQIVNYHGGYCLQAD